MRYFGNDIKISVNKLVVSYTDKGEDDAPVIIFIHGFPLNKSTWDNQLNALKENYRVISYDIRGHGNSESGIDDFSIDLFVTDLLNLMDALEIDKASLCSLSMGGYIAMNAIENHPERFEALVLSDTHCIADPPQVKKKRLDTIESIKEFGVEKYVHDMMVSYFGPKSFITHKNVISEVKEIILNTTEQSLTKTLLALSQRKSTCNKLPQITIPVLFLVGDEDKITPPQASQLMHEKIKNSTMHIISHAGHLSNLENPGEFNEHLRTFFATVYKKPGINNTPRSYSKLRKFRNVLNILLSIYTQFIMKTKISTIYFLLVFTVITFAGCSKDGQQGPAGLDGQNAEVYYSEWFSPTSWSGVAGDWYFSVSAPDLTQSVIDYGVVLAYVRLSGDIYNLNTVRPLPTYALGANWSFLISEIGSIEFTSDMSAPPFNANDKFRFIAIPGTSKALKVAAIKYNTQSKLINMPYSEACKYFDIKYSIQNSK